MWLILITADCRASNPCKETGPRGGSWSCRESATLALSEIELTSAVICLGESITASAQAETTDAIERQPLYYDCKADGSRWRSRSPTVTSGYEITGPFTGSDSGTHVVFTPEQTGSGTIRMWASATMGAPCAVIPAADEQTATYKVLQLAFTEAEIYQCWSAGGQYAAADNLDLPHTYDSSAIAWSLVTIEGDSAATIETDTGLVTFGPDTGGKYTLRAEANELSTCYQEMTLYIIQVELTNIKFNHDTGSSASDAINIRQDYTTPIDISNGEWVKGGANHPVAYTADNSVTIKARFTVQPDSITSADIWAESTASDGSLGDVVKTTIAFAGGVSVGDANGYVEFPISGNTPNVVKKTTTDTWQWKAENINGASVVCNFDVSGPHTVYTIFDEPEQPQWNNDFGNSRNAWVSALEFAIVTCGANNKLKHPAMSSITTALHGMYTYPSPPAPNPTGSRFFKIVQVGGVWMELFDYTDYISGSGADGMANCDDAAMGLATTFKVLGISVQEKKHSPFPGYDYHCYVKDGTFVYDCTRGMLSIRVPYADYLSGHGASGTETDMPTAPIK